MAKRRLEIIIVGGGIGGLFAANALIAHGLGVSLYEQAPALGEVGAGVFLTPNSVRQLQRVGLSPSIEKLGARYIRGLTPQAFSMARTAFSRSALNSAGERV